MRRWFLETEGHAQRQTLRHRRVESFDAEGVSSTMGEARGDPLQFALGNSLEEEGGVCGCFWSMSGELCYRHHVMPREQLYVPKESSFPVPFAYFDVVRRTKTYLDTVEDSNFDDLWNTDGHRIPSESWSGSTKFRILNSRPPKGYPWVDGRLTKKQVTARPEVIWPEVWSSMSKCAQENARPECEIWTNPIFQLHF